MKMDGAIPVEVARLRLGERLVRSGSCGSTGHTCAPSAFRRALQPPTKRQRLGRGGRGTRISPGFPERFGPVLDSGGEGAAKILASTPPTLLRKPS